MNAKACGFLFGVMVIGFVSSAQAAKPTGSVKFYSEKETSEDFIGITSGKVVVKLPIKKIKGLKDWSIYGVYSQWHPEITRVALSRIVSYDISDYNQPDFSLENVPCVDKSACLKALKHLEVQAYNGDPITISLNVTLYLPDGTPTQEDFSINLNDPDVVWKKGKGVEWVTDQFTGTNPVTRLPVNDTFIGGQKAK